MSFNISKASAATKKIQIEQNVPKGSIRKGPYAIERSIDPNEVVIKRRFGEGSKPLFQRDDIVVNPNSINNAADTYTQKQPADESNTNPEKLSNQWQKERCNSTDSSCSERYKKYEDIRNESATSSNNSAPKRTKSSNDRNGSTGKRAVRHSSPPSSSYRRKSPEKLPYFIDEVRERDRIRRKYGPIREKSSVSPSSSRSRRRRSRTISPVSIRETAKHHTQIRRPHRRSNSRDHYSSYNNRQKRENQRSDKIRSNTFAHYRRGSADRNISSRRRSPSIPRGRSRERSTRRRKQSSPNDRRTHNHGEQDEASADGLTERNLPQPQIITIPVPVPAEFINYPYHTWSTSTQWTPPLAQPSRYGTPAAYHMPTVLPTTFMPALRPPLPPYGLPPPLLRYGGRGFRFPMQYGASRPWRPNFRAKNT